MTRLPTPLSVLLVEDHAADAELIDAVLQGPGRLTVTLHHVTRLSDALRAIDERSFDAALLDLTLPDARGVDAVRRLQAARALPLIVLTGRDDEQLGFDALDAGAADYLLKDDLRRARLTRALYNAVQSARVARDLRAREAQVRALNDELRRQIEERTRAVVGLEAANRLKAQFLDIVSHELRTPLTPILGYARLLLRKGENLQSGQRAALEQIAESGERLEAVVDQILQFQTLRSEPLTVRPVPFAPLDLLETLSAAAREHVGDAPVTIGLLAGGLPPRLVADAEQIGGIVERLLENAVTYTPHGRVELHSRVEGERWIIEVRDSGIGIEAEHLEFIFGEFYQAEPSMVRSHGGLGLGLAYARFLAEALGGELGVRSTPGLGSAFRLSVPVLRPDDPAAGQP